METLTPALELLARRQAGRSNTDQFTSCNSSPNDRLLRHGIWPRDTNLNPKALEKMSSDGWDGMGLFSVVLAGQSF